MGQVVWTPQPCKVEHFPKIIQKFKNAPFLQALKTCLGHTFFQKAVIWRLIKIFPWNQLQMATNTLDFQWKKAEPIYLRPLLRYSNLKSGLILSGNFDGFKEILVQVNKAVLGSTNWEVTLPSIKISFSQYVRSFASRRVLEFLWRGCSHSGDLHQVNWRKCKGKTELFNMPSMPFSSIHCKHFFAKNRQHMNCFND